MSKLKVAFVVQRCGKEVIGGSESHCLTIAKKLSSFFDVEVLTTCALDYVTWENHYPEGSEIIDGVLIRRFLVDSPRNISNFENYSVDLFFRMHRVTKKEAERWMLMQGPLSSSLFNYLRMRKNEYDVFIFFTYLYATTYYGLQIVSEKSFLVPTAHDEWPIYFPIWDNWFKLPKFLIFNTHEEKNFLKKRFPNINFKGDVVGVGVEIPKEIRPEIFRKKFKIYSPYILYIGRLDPSKGCDQLFNYFINYKRAFPNPLKLVLIGRKVMDIPFHSDIIYLGPLSEEDKFSAIAGCEFLVNPSPFESLSIVLLEAWSLNKPVLVNGHCEVLVGQCKRSNAGLWYKNYEEFVSCVNFFLKEKSLAKNAKTFVDKNYNWKIIVNKYLKNLLSFVNLNLTIQKYPRKRR